ncbi:MAG TPA: MraY family glycosyltransferase [Ktedonobacteraceae bacterium]|nr:MraY family glycosyltransferase [Ktedonobacteraceae bacterium]
MALALMLHQLLAIIIPLALPGWAALVLGGACAFLLAYGLTFAVRTLCRKMNWLDRPAERRVHKLPMPRLGGIAIFLAFGLASLLIYIPGTQNEVNIYWLLLAASLLTVGIHAYDDVKGLAPGPKLLAQTLAVLIILGPWNGQFQGVLLFTVNNPFGEHFANPSLPWYQQPTIDLLVNSQVISWAAIPAMLLTWFWAVGMMNTVNWIDGMDGLATGVVGITALFITLISLMLGQESIAILAGIFTGAVFGFLPHNWHPARAFMGDSGAMFLGLTLAVLAIMGGAKLALAFMVLGVPILDVALVIINRARRGKSPLHYDKTHLHHRLMTTGFSVRQICYLLYGLSLIFGLLAVSISGLQVGTSAHFFKLIGIGLVGLTMIGLIIWLDRRQRERGAYISPDNPKEPPEAPTLPELTPIPEASASEQEKRLSLERDAHPSISTDQPEQRHERLQTRLPH